MTGRSVTHVTFTLNRDYPHPPEKVFAAFADVDKKRKWFGGGSEDVDWTMDFRVGGREHSSGEVEVHGTRHHSRFDSVYLDIIENRRIIYAYDMDVNGEHVSASLTTIELAPTGMGTHLKLTEQGAFLDGHEDPRLREQGTGGLLDALGRSLND